jgi:type II secretory pathway component PulM
MTLTTLSPRSSRMVALGLLILVIWVIFKGGIATFASRLRLQEEISQLRQHYGELRDRRIDVQSLEQELATLTSSQSIRRIAIVADSDRGATAKLQEIARKSLADANGRLLSLSEMPNNPSASAVAVQLRASIGETLLPGWIGLLEAGDSRVEIADLSITTRSATASKTAEVEASVTLRARWRPPEGKLQ